MKYSLAVILKSAVIFLLGCSRHEPVRSYSTYRIPWNTSSGAYALQDVPLKSLHEPLLLRGSTAKILVDPSSTGNSIEGSDPIGRFIEADGIQIPADFTTLQAVTVFAHLERLRDLDQRLGIDKHLSWPLNVGIQANIFERDKPILNNALFDGVLNALLIVPYTDRDLPISMNGGILAHEHFHSLFYALVLKGLGRVNEGEELGEEAAAHMDHFQVNERFGVVDSPKDAPESKLPAAGKMPVRKFNFGVLRGFNEGLADFWGWIYTGDADFMSHSVKGASEPRGLGSTAHPLPSSANLAIHFSDSNDGKTVAAAYFLGTSYARLLYSLAIEEFGEHPRAEQRELYAMTVMKTLQSLEVRTRAIINSELLSPRLLLDILLQQELRLSSKGCDLISKFVKNENANLSLPEVCGSK